MIHRYFFMSFALMCSITAHDYMLSIMKNSTSRDEFSGFLSEVLRQVDPKQFYELTTSIIQNDTPKTDIQLYTKLLQKISAVTYTPEIIYKFKAHLHQKEVLGNQIHQLLGSNKTINGMVEIGTPGIYTKAVKSFATVSGPCYVMNEQEQLQDYIQSFSFSPRTRFLPYDIFLTLDYEPITESSIASKSVDLIVCVIGLHHIPVEKIDPFIASLTRILRPGGTFILRDHDSHSLHITKLVHTAHSVFNAIVTREPVEREQTEYRNFQPLAHWIERLENHGFTVGPLRLLQVGDPTLNTLIACMLTEQSEQHVATQISHALKVSNTEKQSYNPYERDILESYLSGPEWLNVDAAQEYGHFINTVPFYQFPYMAYVKAYWHVFANAWKTGAKKKGTWAVLTAPATLMNLFIGVTMTAEYATKSIISAPVRWSYAGNAPQSTKVLIKDPSNSVAQISGHSGIITIKEYPGTALKLVGFPRYKEFMRALAVIEDYPLELVEIAGQKEIQVKIRYPHSQAKHLFTQSGCILEYEWTLPTQPDYTYAALTIQVPQLLTVLHDLKKAGMQILYVHDF